MGLVGVRTPHADGDGSDSFTGMPQASAGAMDETWLDFSATILAFREIFKRGHGVGATIMVDGKLQNVAGLASASIFESRQSKSAATIL